MYGSAACGAARRTWSVAQGGLLVDARQRGASARHSPLEILRRSCPPLFFASAYSFIENTEPNSARAFFTGATIKRVPRDPFRGDLLLNGPYMQDVREETQARARRRIRAPSEYTSHGEGVADVSL